MGSDATVIVAGAGALGLATALALADAGCRVTVCDPAQPFSGASGVAAGMLAPVFETLLDSDGPDDLSLLLAARDLWPQLAQRAGITLDRSGAVAVGPEPWMARVRAGFDRLGLLCGNLDRAALAAQVPGLSECWRGGVMTPEDWRLEPALALAALRRAARDAGVVFRAEPVRDRGAADWLVAATGWSRDLAPELAHLSPIKGHIVRVQLADAGRMSVRGEGGYAVPAAGGLAVGATMEWGVTDARVDPGQAWPLLAAGAQLFPALAAAPFTVAAGIRGTTPDGLPMVGASSEPGVLVAAGARRNGWLLAPLVAQTVTAIVAGREPGPHAARFAPARFSRLDV